MIDCRGFTGCFAGYFTGWFTGKFLGPQIFCTCLFSELYYNNIAITDNNNNHNNKTGKKETTTAAIIIIIIFYFYYLSCSYYTCIPSFIHDYPDDNMIIQNNNIFILQQQILRYSKLSTVKQTLNTNWLIFGWQNIIKTLNKNIINWILIPHSHDC